MLTPAFVGALACVFASVVSTPPDSLLTFVAGRQFAAGIDSGIDVRIPIVAKAEGDAGSPLSVRVLQVTVENHIVPALQTLFGASIESTSGAVDGWLRITAKPSAALRPGSYDLLLLVSPTRSANGPAERYSVKLTLEPAVLRAPSNLTVTITRPWIPMGSTDVSATTLDLEETGGYSRLRPLTLRPLDATGPDALPVAGRVTFDSNVTISPGGRTLLAPRADRDFPLGKSTTTMEVSAPQLKSPVNFKVEVLTRRDPMVIFWIGALGLLLGWLVRTGLELRIQRNTVKLDALDLLRRVRAERANRPDDALRQKLEAIDSALQLALNGRDVATLKKAVEDQNANLTKALGEFAAAVRQAQADVDAFDAKLAGGWSLPPSLQQEVDNARAAVSSARTAVTAQNPTQALGLLNTAKQQLSDNVPKFARDFASQVLDDVTELRNAPFTDGALTAALEKVETDANAIPLSSSSDATLLLGASETAHRTLISAFQCLARELDATAFAVRNAFAGKSVREPGQLEKFACSATALARTVRSHAGMGTPAPELTTQLTQLRDDLRAALNAQLPDPPDDALKARFGAVVGALDKGALTEAAQSLAQALPRKSGVFMDDAGARTAAASAGPSQSVPQPAEFVSLGARAAGPVMVTHVETAIAPVDPLASESIQTARQLFQAKGLQTLLAGIGILFVGYLIFSKSFIGTAADVSAVFFWAFTLDMSVATLLTLAGRVKPATA